MTSHITALLILNNSSRNGGDADIQQGLSLLENANITLIRKSPSSAEECRKIIAEHANQVQLVILGGGDGTISSAAETLYQHKLPLAILPLGTANDLARSLEIPTNLTEAFQTILDNRRSKIDLGVLNGHYFLNAAHIGLGVKVSHELTPNIKKKLGIFSYLHAVFAAFKNNKSFRVNITIDGKTQVLRSIQLTVGNGRYYGGGNIVDERSAINDGLLRVYSIPPTRFWDLLSHAFLLRNGKQREIENIFTASGKRIEINTKRPKEIHADGEGVCNTPALFEIIPQALEVIRPRPATL
ncbi:lipid kinase [Cellvibrio sp. OA-2007]|uniref:lipid kinase n=1 Tax=Cellvibrio sp. OA-2007 TaxID=529823 RepID=UPI000B21C2E2|nr:lipid kinase [Cellvibrio sp. OA-2007]